MTVAIYPGTFDPVTLGHVDVATRVSRIFERVIVAVYGPSPRNPLFGKEERVEMFKRAVDGLANVEVESFEGLVVEYARRVGAEVMVRGLRGGSDFEYEYEMAFMNKELAPDVETMCLMTSLEYQFISSSLLKEVAGLGGDIRNLVFPHVAEAVREKFGFPKPSI